MGALNSIFDSLGSRINIGERLKTIDLLFSHSNCIAEDWFGNYGSLYDTTIEDYADGSCFLAWPHRNGTSSPKHLREVLGISNLHVIQYDQVKICFYLEYVYNMTMLVLQSAESSPSVTYDNNVFSALISDIDDAAGHLGMKIIDRGNEQFVLCVNDAPVMEAASIAEPDEMACLVEFLHFANNGNLERKRELLASLYRGFEARRAKLRSGGSQKLESEIGNIANNLNIRHNNLSGSKENPELKQVTDDWLENQYDYLAGLYAESILAERRIDIQKTELEA